MTNLEAIREDLRPYPVRSSLIQRKCEKYGLEALADASEESKITRVVIEILFQMWKLNNVGEGGVSLSFDKDGVKAQIKHLCSEIGVDSSEFFSEPKVTYLGDI
jgi:hypothetical protein